MIQANNFFLITLAMIAFGFLINALSIPVPTIAIDF